MAAAHRSLAGAGAALAIALLPLAPLAQGPVPQPPASAASSGPSEAERLLFLQDHLANTRRPAQLHYRYVEDGTGQPQVADRAVLNLTAGAGGRCCDARAEYLSGARVVNLPEIPDAHANPVLLYFLEGEVRRLQRTTGGQASHFRRRMRQALADEARVEETTIRWADRSVPARAVRVAPFLADPFRGRFEAQAATEYVFLFADAVPGGVYQAAALLPGAAAGAPALARRTLTFEEARP